MQMVMYKQFWRYLWYLLSIMAILLLVVGWGGKKTCTLCVVILCLHFRFESDLLPDDCQIIIFP